MIKLAISPYILYYLLPPKILHLDNIDTTMKLEPIKLLYRG